jgi:hypothetical protein
MYFLSAFISKLVTGQAFTRTESTTPATRRKKSRFTLVLIVDSASARDQASISSHTASHSPRTFA